MKVNTVPSSEQTFTWTMKTKRPRIKVPGMPACHLLHHVPSFLVPPSCLPGPPAPLQQAVSLPFLELLFGNFKLLTQENQSYSLKTIPLIHPNVLSDFPHYLPDSYPDKVCQMSETKYNYKASNVIYWTLKSTPKENYQDLSASWDTHALPSMTTVDGNPGQDTCSLYSWFPSQCPIAL